MERKVDRAPKLAADLVRAKVDLILVTGGSNRIRAAKNATKTIPIVMVNSVLDVVEEGLVESLARPGGNITGLTLLSRDLAGKTAASAQSEYESCACRGCLRTG